MDLDTALRSDCICNLRKSLRYIIDVEKDWVWILVLGEDMVRDGYLDVVNVDNSSTCFDQLNLRYKGNKDIPSAFT